MTQAQQHSDLKVAIVGDERDIPDYKKVHLNNIDEIYDGMLTELYLPFTLEYHNNAELMNKILRKVAYGGKIIIHGYDLYELSYGYSNYLFTEEKFKEIILNKVNIFSIDSIIKLLETHNYTITSKVILNKTYLVQGQRNEPNNKR